MDEQRLRREQGLDRERYRVVPRTLVVVRRAGRVLLIRRADDRPLWPGRYNGPGGHVDAGEGIAESARRELFEETGLVADEVHLAGLLHVSRPGWPDGVLVFVFVADSETGDVRGSDEGEPVWVDPDEASRLDLVPDLRRLLPVLAGTGRPARPFVAVARADEPGALWFDGDVAAADGYGHPSASKGEPT